MLEDEVIYDDLTPWPTIIVGGGQSIARASTDAYGNSPSSWVAAGPSPGRFRPNVLGDLTHDGGSTSKMLRIAPGGASGGLVGRFDRTMASSIRTIWFSLIEDILKTHIGDINFDGVFDSNDIIELLALNEFEDGIPNNSTYAEGDWDLDGEFTSADLLMAWPRRL